MVTINRSNERSVHVGASGKTTVESRSPLAQVHAFISKFINEPPFCRHDRHNEFILDTLMHSRKLALNVHAWQNSRRRGGKRRLPRCLIPSRGRRVAKRVSNRLKVRTPETGNSFPAHANGHGPRAIHAASGLSTSIPETT